MDRAYMLSTSTSAPATSAVSSGSTSPSIHTPTSSPKQASSGQGFKQATPTKATPTKVTKVPVPVVPGLPLMTTPPKPPKEVLKGALQSALGDNAKTHDNETRKKTSERVAAQPSSPVGAKTPTKSPKE